MAVAGAVALAGDVDPVDATVGGLFDELVGVAIVHDPGEPSVEDVDVCEALALFARKVILGNAYVAGFAGHVLAVLHSTDGFVQGR